MKIHYLRFALITLISVSFSNSTSSQITIAFDSESEQVFHGVNLVRNTLTGNGEHVYFTGGSGESKGHTIRIISNPVDLESLSQQKTGINPEKIRDEGFQIVYSDDNNELNIVARDGIGAMYGLIQLRDHLEGNGNLFNVNPSINNPYFEYRIIKFNLPWSPYRDSPATSIHMETCKDLDFWEKFLDMMAENRFNVLSLWNSHPFSYMIRAKNFPEATPFNDIELSEWQNFWKTLFRMARNRGIQTFIVNWNIVVSPEFADVYGAEVYNDQSDLVKKYTRESVTQLINEYEDLSGIGVTLADWMGNFDDKMSAKEREDWIEETFVAGMKDANRKIKFLHRSVLSGSPIEMRRVIDHADLDDPALVEVKFNWSHGHSTPTLAITHDYHSGVVDDRFWNPKPDNYNIQWMIRNEDFFILRWGQPDFIRQHIATNTHDFVNGYFIGSEGYIPAMDYSHKIHPHKTWQYGFEKQWLFYKLWGRLLYDPNTTDKVFADAFESRYGKEIADDLLEAYSLASIMPLRMASFYRSTWDYTLYSEGFLAPRPSNSEGFFDNSSDFISIDELIYHETLDPALMSIKDFIEMDQKGLEITTDIVTPTDLASELDMECKKALDIVKEIREQKNVTGTTLESELEDITTWAYLGLYFSSKLRGGIALETYRQSGINAEKTKSIAHLMTALKHWEKVVEHTKDRYQPVPHVSIPSRSKDYTVFSWEYFLPQVKRDIEIASNAKFMNK
ncbi:hypothetical protein ACFLU5_00635 [Bacteroidota bacterium]